MKSIKMVEFQRVLEVKDNKDLQGKDFSPGYKFLIGESMIEQKYNKYPGEEVTIYKIVKNDKEGIMYIPEYYLIEKENKNA